MKRDELKIVLLFFSTITTGVFCMEKHFAVINYFVYTAGLCVPPL